MNVPEHLLYTKSHEWVLFAGDGSAKVGLTDHAQDALGDIVFVNLPEAGDSLAKGEALGDVESVKAVSDVYGAGSTTEQFKKNTARAMLNLKAYMGEIFAALGA